VGSRYDDQPPEHWAGAESLDPTPVWKQYALVGLLALGGLVVVLVVALLAVLPQIVTPPALVAGDRLVLPTAELPAVNAPPRRIEPTLADTGRSFYLAHPSKDEALAFRERWAPSVGAQECDVTILTLATGGGFEFGYTANCERIYGRLYAFDARGASRDGSYRGLDRYLVSVSDDRVIVNLSRLIRADEKVPAPSQP
jgi:hypothetical protein